MLVEWLTPLMSWFGFTSIIELMLAVLIIIALIKD